LSHLQIKVAKILAESRSDGPFLRSVLWVQGCAFHCAGCWNPAMQDPAGGESLDLNEVERRLTASSAVEGVTFLGGEPFAQAKALAELAARLKKRGLGLMAYSGNTLAEISRGPAAGQRLLALCDLLVDGRFVQDQAADLLWRGSQNQILHFLTDRYRAFASEADRPYRNFEAAIGADGMVQLTGDPDARLLESLRPAAGKKAR
jgi:anaerobic ribonucleoside-triphosphate reductase activating protein